MKGQSLNANIVSIALVGFIALFLVIVPIRIEFGVPETAAQETPAPSTATDATVSEEAPVPQVREYTLRTVLGQTPPMAFHGVGGSIDGQINPMLEANVGDTVRITVVNGDPVMHDLTINEFNVTTGQLLEDEQTVTIEFVANLPGEFDYYCSVPGHREIGMFGKLRVSGTVEVGERTELAESQGSGEMAHTVVATPEPAVADAVSVVRNPADIPPPIEDRGPITLRVDMDTVEVTGVLADGTTFEYFTFDGKVPGPMLRVRQDDIVEFHLHNDTTSLFPHSIDLHSVTGPGGGAVYTSTLPGGESVFTFQALNPGLYVYHCATASIPHHISSGMYGLILVEPPGGLPPVDREFYVMQGDIYTEFEFGTAGHQPFSMDHMRHEDADYLVFNGAVGGLTTEDNVLRANVGETVRIFFGVGGPNYTSSFHVIGEIFDRVYPEGALTSNPLTNVQTTFVPTGGSAIVEFQVDVPGRYILVDHSLSRLERGLAGFLVVEGEAHPEIFSGQTLPESSGH
ncbi:MAG: nitrite reductase, copper-containing [Anaerolineae bacterium]|nr:nitrite reductase, copper-containing [Anaerolineae bacterium]